MVANSERAGEICRSGLSRSLRPAGRQRAPGNGEAAGETQLVDHGGWQIAQAHGFGHDPARRGVR